MGLQSVEVRVLWVRETAALRACCRGAQNKDEDVFRNPSLLPQAWEDLRNSLPEGQVGRGLCGWMEDVPFVKVLSQGF